MFLVVSAQLEMCCVDQAWCGTSTASPGLCTQTQSSHAALSVHLKNTRLCVHTQHVMFVCTLIDDFMVYTNRLSTDTSCNVYTQSMCAVRTELEQAQAVVCVCV